jgi:hypothetical protein
MRCMSPSCDMWRDGGCCGIRIAGLGLGLLWWLWCMLSWTAGRWQLPCGNKPVFHVVSCVPKGLAPWATATGRQLQEARLRRANEVYEPIMRQVESWWVRQMQGLWFLFVLLVAVVQAKLPCAAGRWELPQARAGGWSLWMLSKQSTYNMLR